MAPSNGHSESEHFSPYRSDGKLYGFVCIVTEATSPVGKSVVTELAAHGAACVYACSSSPSEDFQDLVDEVGKQYSGTKIIDHRSKLADEEATLTLIDDVLNTWGRLDIYVTLALSPGPESISDTTSTLLHSLFESNTMAPFFALKYAPPAMAKTTPKGNYPNSAPKDHSYGSIIVVNSIASTSGGIGGVGFTMSSHAALGVVKAGVGVLKGTGVRINCISAGLVGDGLAEKSSTKKSELTDVVGLGRAGLPEEVGRVAGFLASGFSSYVTGANIVVDGGASAMSSLTLPV